MIDEFSANTRMKDYIRNYGSLPARPCDATEIQLAGGLDSLNLRPWYENSTLVTPDNVVAVTRPEFVLLGIPYPDDATLRNCGSSMFDAFNDQIPANVSIANFIYELKDLKDLLPKLEKNLLSVAKNGFLSWNFGWKPMISDLKKLAGLMKSIEARLKWLKANYGKPVSIRFHKGNAHSVDVSSIPAWTPNWGGPSGHIIRYKLEYYYASFAGHGTLVQFLEGLDGPLAKLIAANSALGLDRPLEVFWNAIPYSFVADWFFNIGDILHKVGAQTFTGKWDVSNVTYSWKFNAQVGVYQDYWTSNSLKAAGNQSLKLSTYLVKRYERKLGCPYGLSNLTGFDSLSSTQQLLLTALAGNLLEGRH